LRQAAAAKKQENRPHQKKTKNTFYVLYHPGGWPHAALHTAHRAATGGTGALLSKGTE
jgi:hypothetical protein